MELKEVKVGQRYDWGDAAPVDLLTITKVEGDKFWFKCDDGYESDAYLSQTNSWTLLEEDAVKAPSHYTNTRISALDVIDDWGLDFRLGNTIKYIKRYKDKGNPIQDLEKALTYLQFEIDKLKREV